MTETNENKYRLNLESLRNAFPGKEVITIKDTAKYLGLNVRTVKDCAPTTHIGNRDLCVIVNLARWLSV